MVRASAERGTLMLDTLIACIITVIAVAVSTRLMTPSTGVSGTQASAIVVAAISEARSDAMASNTTQSVIVVPATSTTTLLYEGSGNPYAVYTAETAYAAPDATVIHVTRTIPMIVTAWNGTTTLSSFVVAANADGSLTMGALSDLASSSLLMNPHCSYANEFVFEMGPERVTADCATGALSTDFSST